MTLSQVALSQVTIYHDGHRMHYLGHLKWVGGNRSKERDRKSELVLRSTYQIWVGGNRSKEQDRKSELVLRSTYQIFEWDRNNSDRNFYNVVRYVHIPLVP